MLLLEMSPGPRLGGIVRRALACFKALQIIEVRGGALGARDAGLLKEVGWPGCAGQAGRGLERGGGQPQPPLWAAPKPCRCAAASRARLPAFCYMRRGVLKGAPPPSGPQGLLKHPGLRALRLQNTRLADAGAAALAEVLEGHVPLQELQVQGCGLGPAGALRLAQALRINFQLQRLDLSANALGPAALQALAAALQVGEAAGSA
jgi:hypothetical protein